MAAGHHQAVEVALGDVGPGQEQLANGPAIAVFADAADLTCGPTTMRRR